MELARKVRELGDLRYEEVQLEEAIRLLGEVGLPKHIDHDFLDDHDALDLVYLRDELVGYGYVMCSGALEVLEIHEDRRREGIAAATLLDWFGGQDFRFFMANHALVSLMERLGEVHVRDDGFGTCIPRKEWTETRASLR
jgi:hypothetical protein